jgi:DNA repair protein RecO
MPDKIKTCGFLFRKQLYSESSVLMQVFSDSLGMISVLAKGLRKQKQHQDFLLNALNEYEFVLTCSPNSGIHILTEFTLISEYPTDLPMETWFSAQAGAEIISKLILPPEEMPAIYLALKQYLAYQKAVKSNSIAIFWRFLLHLYKLLGVPINLSICSSCHRNIGIPAGYNTENGQLICHGCQALLPVSSRFEPEVASVLQLLPVIGNYLEDLNLRPDTIQQINRFFLNYFSLQFHKPIQLNSLQYFHRLQEPDSGL